MSLKSPHPTKIERGAYSAIVFKDGDLIVAEDNVGTVLKEDTDAATVIQAALDIGGKTFIKQGTHLISTALVPSPNTILEGEGIDATILKASTTITKIIDITAASTMRNTIQFMTIDGDGKATKCIDGHAASSRCACVTINKCKIGKATQIGVDLSNCEDTVLRDCTIYDHGQYGLHVEETNGNYFVDRCVFTSPSIQGTCHAYLKDGQCAFTHCSFEGAADYEPTDSLLKLESSALIISLDSCWLFSKTVPQIHGATTSPGYITINGGQYYSKLDGSVENFRGGAQNLAILGVAQFTIAGSATSNIIVPAGYSMGNLYMYGARLDKGVDTTRITRISMHQTGKGERLTRLQSVAKEFIAGEAISAFDLCYVSDSTGARTVDRMYKADADTEAYSNQLLGIAPEAVSSGAKGTFILSGEIYKSAWGLARGIQYISQTAGAITHTKPSASGTVIRAVGETIDTATIWFEPDRYYEVNP